MMAASPALSDEAQCRAVLLKCDDALQAQQEVNSLQKQIIADQDARFKAQSEQLDSQAIWKPVAIGAVAVVVLETLILVLKK